MAAASQRLRLPRAMRLQRGGEFSEARRRGQRLVRGCLIANWYELPDGASRRLGVVTTRKLGSAVVRNRARRLLRESFRLQQHSIRPGIGLVLVARASIVGKERQAVERDLVSALRAAGVWSQAR
ncbi:MAG: ribonuclease P protein component [Verrucomicrobia bacterium]|nr:ribonuclease P protein component [Verrucomicrobiota bacterium]